MSDGYAFLDNLTKTTDVKEWGRFITVLYDDILNNKFPKTSTAFEIPYLKFKNTNFKKRYFKNFFD